MFLLLQNTEVKALLKRKLGLKNGKALTGVIDNGSEFHATGAAWGRHDPQV